MKGLCLVIGLIVGFITGIIIGLSHEDSDEHETLYKTNSRFD